MRIYALSVINQPDQDDPGPPICYDKNIVVVPIAGHNCMIDGRRWISYLHYQLNCKEIDSPLDTLIESRNKLSPLLLHAVDPSRQNSTKGIDD